MFTFNSCTWCNLRTRASVSHTWRCHFCAALRCFSHYPPSVKVFAQSGYCCIGSEVRQAPAGMVGVRTGPDRCSLGRFPSREPNRRADQLPYLKERPLILTCGAQTKGTSVKPHRLGKSRRRGGGSTIGSAGARGRGDRWGCELLVYWMAASLSERLYHPKRWRRLCFLPPTCKPPSRLVAPNRRSWRSAHEWPGWRAGKCRRCNR